MKPEADVIMEDPSATLVSLSTLKLDSSATNATLTSPTKLVYAETTDSKWWEQKSLQRNDESSFPLNLIFT